MARRVYAVDAVSGAAPDIAFLVGTETVREAGLDLVELARFCESPAVVHHVEDADEPDRIGRELLPALRDIEQALVGREAEAVRPLEIIGDDGEGAVPGVEPKDAAGGNSGSCLPPS